MNTQNNIYISYGFHKIFWGERPLNFYNTERLPSSILTEIHKSYEIQPFTKSKPHYTVHIYGL